VYLKLFTVILSLNIACPSIVEVPLQLIDVAESAPKLNEPLIVKSPPTLKFPLVVRVVAVVVARVEVPETDRDVAEVDFRVDVPLMVRFPLVENEGVEAIVNLKDSLKLLSEPGTALGSHHPNNKLDAEEKLSIAK